jgi:hypothetical protein
MTHVDLQRRLAGVRERRADVGMEWVSDRSCPLKLIGKRCEGFPCICQNKLNDHGTTNRKPQGETFVLWEPYGNLGIDDLAQLAETFEPLGIRVTVGLSVWNPPWTVGIWFQQQKTR